MESGIELLLARLKGLALPHRDPPLCEIPILIKIKLDYLNYRNLSQT